MRVSVARPDELGPGELARWRALQAAEPALHHPFLAPEFTLAVGRHRGGARVAVLQDGGEVVGFFPFERRGLGRAVPIGSYVNNYQGLVHRAGAPPDRAALLRGCGLTVWEFDQLPASQQALATAVVAGHTSPVMDLGAGFAAYHDRLLANSRRGGPGVSVRELPRKQRRLARDVGDPQFTYSCGDVAVLRTLMSWKSAQYRRTGHFDRFARPWVVGVLTDLLSTGSADFEAVLAVLAVQGRPIAAHLLLRYRDVLGAWFPAFDRELARYSPGLLLRLRLAEAAAARGVRHIDMGEDEGGGYKALFRSHDVTMLRGRLTRPSVGAALHGARRDGLRGVRDFVVARPAVFRVADTVRVGAGRIDARVRRALAGREAR
ncbi:MAG: GNAT family N-acetyltransferase [Pseudonocardia sp.]